MEGGREGGTSNFVFHKRKAHGQKCKEQAGQSPELPSGVVGSSSWDLLLQSTNNKTSRDNKQAETRQVRLTCTLASTSTKQRQPFVGFLFAPRTVSWTRRFGEWNGSKDSFAGRGGTKKASFSQSISHLLLPSTSPPLCFLPSYL